MVKAADEMRCIRRTKKKKKKIELKFFKFDYFCNFVFLPFSKPTSTEFILLQIWQKQKEKT